MVDKKLQSFKAGERQRPRAEANSKKKGNAEATATMGFARIETLLDQEPPVEVGKRLAELLDSLAAYEDEATTAKQRAGVKKGRLAVERTIDLLDYLFRTKEALQQAAAKKSAPNAKP